MRVFLKLICKSGLTAAVVGACVVGAGPAGGQVVTPYTAKQCDAIRNNILGIFQRYTGRISAELVADLKEFSRRDCDRTVQLRMVPGTRDKDAVGELKLLIASRQ